MLHVIQPALQGGEGVVKGEALVGNTLMGLVGFFLVIAAVALGVEGVKGLSEVQGSKPGTQQRRRGRKTGSPVAIAYKEASPWGKAVRKAEYSGR